MRSALTGFPLLPDRPQWVVDKPYFGEPVTDWLPWFAWRPIRTWDGRYRWLCWVERRRIIGHDFLSPPIGDWWQMRARP